MKKTKYIIISVFILAITGCAQITAPTGGDRDTIAPKLDTNKTTPNNYSTSFNKEVIHLTFDEYFTIKNPTVNVFISPTLSETPEYIVKGKTLTIDLKNKLEENTTYTINFGDAISDYTAGNKISDFKYVFSTGDFIDSMQFSGNIKDAFTNNGEEGLLVMLYNNSEDSVVTKSTPNYFAKTDKEGNYSFQYIKEGAYKIFALKDENRNYKYDLPNEKTGFLKDVIELKDTQKTASVNFTVFDKKNEKQQISSKKYTFPGKLTLVFEKNTKKIELLNLDETPLTYHKKEVSKNGDSIVIWKTDERFNKTNIIVKADNFRDTIKIYNYKNPRKDTGVDLNINARQIDENTPVFINSDRPIMSLDSTKFIVSKDSVLINKKTIKFNSKGVFLSFDSKETERFRYEILPNAVTDIFGYSNLDTIIGFINVREKDFYGTFILDFKPQNDSANYIIQLLDEKENVVRKKEITKSKKIIFDNLFPRKYKIKVILDKNKNGRWDTGDYYKNLQPEPVYYLPTVIEIRSNWELEEEFIF